jgi:hypothetical protein
MPATLCGPIDFCEQSPALWRRRLSPLLRDQGGQRVCDPPQDAGKVLSNEEIAHVRVRQRTALDRFRRTVPRRMAFGTELLENGADDVVCCRDSQTDSSGATRACLSAAYREGIPVYLVASSPVEDIDAWMLGCSDPVFSPIEGLQEFLAVRFSREKQPPLWKD